MESNVADAPSLTTDAEKRMTTIMIIAGIVLLIAIAVAVVGFKDWCLLKRNHNRYLAKRSDRIALPDEQFCARGGLDESICGIVATIRCNLAEYGKCDPTRINPEDSLSDFALNYDDDVAMLVQKIGIVPGFKDYSFPLEEVDSVADFVKVVVRMKTEAEHAAAGYGSQARRT